MLKKLSIGLIAALSISAVQAETNYKKLYKVTVLNLTTGQPITPAVIAVHAPGYKIAHLGHKASLGLGELAKDGKADNLLAELEASKYVVRTAKGQGVVLPGKKESIVVEANNPNFKISLVAMLARTNDAITMLDTGSLHLSKGQKTSYLTAAYDAGVELNTESCSDIPAPPCNNPNQGEVEDSFVRPHAGVLQVGDLDPKRDSFGSKVAKIIIERIQ